jgi:hypothetical protein
MLAAAWGKEVTCDLLLDLGADPTIRDKQGRTMLSLASNGLRMHLIKHAKLHPFRTVVKVDLIMGSDIDEKWRQAILESGGGGGGSSYHGSHSSSEESSLRGNRVSENYNICLYKTVVKTKEAIAATTTAVVKENNTSKSATASKQ